MWHKQKYFILSLICASFATGALVYSISTFMFDSGTGTVEYIGIEGGFYGIITDEGERYDPTNLAAEFQFDGLRVQFIVQLRRYSGSIHMWGMIVKVLYIRQI